MGERIFDLYILKLFKYVMDFSLSSEVLQSIS
jgi:hypothetical protein